MKLNRMVDGAATKEQSKSDRQTHLARAIYLRPRARFIFFSAVRPRDILQQSDMHDHQTDNNMSDMVGLCNAGIRRKKGSHG